MSNLFDFLVNYSEIDLRSYDIVQHDKNWYETHSKIYYDFWIITSGKVKIFINNKEHILSKNDVFFIYPDNIYHANSQTETCEFIYVRFNFKIGNNNRGLDEFSLYGHIPSSAIDNEVKQFIDSFIAFKNMEPMSSFTLHGYFTVLLSKVIGYQLENNLNHASIATNKKIARLQNVFEYVSNNIWQPISVVELAEMLNMNEKYFITYFKNAVGITPAKYITQVKMDKALVYIYEGKYTIKEISEMLGYSDQYTFSKAFSKMYCIAPSKIKDR